MVPAELLMLADGRFPSGAHAHSAGLEAAVAELGVGDAGSLEAFVVGRLATVGRVEAACAAAAAVDAGAVVAVDAELDARIASPALRAASRSLGRQLVRSARRVWPDVAAPLELAEPHQPVALGCVCRWLGFGAADAASLSLHHLVATITNAAVRLLGLDPFVAQRVAVASADLRAAIVAESAAGTVAWAADPATLPSTANPLAELLAEDHAGWDIRLFAS